MPSFISNFKERLRLPRLFFRKPSRAEQIHGGPPLEFERPIPPVPWRGMTVIMVVVVVAATAAWELSEKAGKGSHSQTPAQRASQYLAFPLEEHVAFLKQEDLTLSHLLRRLPIPNRPWALVPPMEPPYFQTLDRERRARMTEERSE